MDILNKQIISHWNQLRAMTYDFLELIQEEDLVLKLPFEKSQNLGYQIHCMAGTQESSIDYIKTGEWTGWSCSFDNIKDISKSEMIEVMKEDDEKLIKMISHIDLLEENAEGSERSPLQRYMILVEHESHHQGQIINFIYAHSLKIPKSWKEKWALDH